MRTYAVSGIVLRRIDLGEKDRILTVYSREKGKLSAVAKGSRRPGSKLAGASEPLTYSRMFLSAGRELEVLTQAEIRESFPNLRGSISSIAYGIYLLELVSHFVDEIQPNPDLFDTLLSSLYVLESGTDPEITARHFELQVLSILGYEPRFEACLRCEREFGREKIAFSPSLGGVVCQECGAPPSDAIIVPSALVSYVRALRKAEPQNLRSFSIPPGARRDLARVLRWHIRYRMERDLRSVEFIRVVEGADGESEGTA